MNPVAFRATLLNILGNSGLFALKLTAGILSGSIALISEALNSLSDIAASIATFICVKISDKRADEGHPFGHSRAEPIAGLIIAVLAGILGFEVIRASVERLLSDRAPEIGLFAIAVPLITMAAKGLMGLHFKKAGKLINSPALRATATDSFMDVFIAVAALTGILGARAGYPFLDPAAGLVISVWIIYTGYSIGVENIDYLMGKSPEPELLMEIKKAAMQCAGVISINTVRAHYVGSFIHVEIHVEVDKALSTYDSHEIGKQVERNVEAIKSIEKSFVHIDPV
ncbi:MAG: cation transporter [Deltaproteobacteria bacterium]|nr:cation transporter [Deltaproteobacteria bacterium]